MPLSESTSQHLPLIGLGAAAICFYSAARLGVTALASRITSPARLSGALAVAHWLPMAAVAVVKLRDAPDASVNVVFAASIASLALALGTILLSSEVGIERDDIDAAPQRRAWPMLLPVAVIVLLAGFRGHFTITHAALLVVQGILALILWFDPTDRAATTLESSITDRSAARLLAAYGKLLAWIVLAMIGAVMAAIASTRMVQNVPRLTIPMVGALMIAPALALPLIGGGLNLFRTGQAATSISACVGCALLNLCVLLPLTIIAAHAHAAIRTGGVEALRRTAWLQPDEPILMFPITIWRIDTVLLILLGAALVPLSTGRWLPRKLEGSAMLLLYAVYMATSAALSVR